MKTQLFKKICIKSVKFTFTFYASDNDYILIRKSETELIINGIDPFFELNHSLTHPVWGSDRVLSDSVDESVLIDPDCKTASCLILLTNLTMCCLILCQNQTVLPDPVQESDHVHVWSCQGIRPLLL